jgi:hypothetical protein
MSDHTLFPVLITLALAIVNGSLGFIRLAESAFTAIASAARTASSDAAAIHAIWQLLAEILL